MSNKSSLRKLAAEMRAGAHSAFDPGPAQAALQTELEGLPGVISFYWPIRTEIDPRPVAEAMAAQGRDLCLPLTHGRNAGLTFRQWSPGCEMDRDGFGVAYPSGTMEMTPDILIVPLLAFDPRGHRLGYGAGHYDRTLARLRREGTPIAIGFAYGAQRFPDLPIEPTDEPLDAIVTEAGIIRI